MRAFTVHPRDNVATALADLKADERSLTITLKGPVPFGHKFSLTLIETGSPIIKYGEAIGTATKPVEKMVIQKIGGAAAALERGARLAGVMASDAAKLKREKVDD